MAKPPTQVCVVPFRRRDGEPEFCLITSSSRRQWIFPKGSIDPGESSVESGLKEAREEAGLSGRIVAEEIARFEVLKKGRGPLPTVVHLMEVEDSADDWPERSVRDRTWLPAREVRKRLEDSPFLPALEAALAVLGTRPAVRYVPRPGAGLRARTNEEAHLYMDLHGCPACGSPAFDRTHHVVERNGDLVGVYRGLCAGCGAPRAFEFLVPHAPLPPTRPMSFGGGEPSPIICPGEFLAVADALSKRAPASPAGLTEAARSAARRSLERAAAAIDEILKFIPAGQDCVPPAAFFSDRGRAALKAEPGRFRKPRLEAVLRAYREVLRVYEAHRPAD